MYVLALLHFSSAFDTINHLILAHRLNTAVGIYKKDRQQINNKAIPCTYVIMVIKKKIVTYVHGLALLLIC